MKAKQSNDTNPAMQTRAMKKMLEIAERLNKDSPGQFHSKKKECKKLQSGRELPPEVHRFQENPVRGTKKGQKNLKLQPVQNGRAARIRLL